MRDIKTMPKVELHCHLDGSIYLDVMKELAAAAKKPLELSESELRRRLVVPEHCTSLAEYLERFELPLEYLSVPDCFRIAAYGLMAHAAAEGVCYMEIRFAPSLSVTAEMTAGDIVQSVIDGIRLAEQDYDIRGNVLICFMRHEPVADNIRLLHELKKFYGSGVCGIDTAGNEAAFPMSSQRELFEEARALGIPFTIHAGECGSADNIREAVELGAKRIGHGIAMKDAPGVRRLCAERQIGIEMCPTSNVQTKAIDDICNYPIEQFLKEGLKVTINTDNRVVSDTSMTQELELVYEQFAVDPELVTSNAIAVCFADEATKEWLREKLKQEP